jgi:hypothetical protein
LSPINQYNCVSVLFLALFTMKPVFAFAIIFLSCMAKAQDPLNFDAYFTDETLRIDYFHTGDAKTELYALDKIYRQDSWAGNPDHCIQPFELGNYRVEVYDITTNLLLFSKGYSSIFAEYQTIGPAILGVKKTCHESVLIPCPRKPFLLVIQKRDRQNIPAPVFIQKIDPSDYHIHTHPFKGKKDEILPVVYNGSPHTCVDLVILAEGYQADESAKFRNDLKYYTDLFFSMEPYKSRMKLFNVTGVFSPSEESGTDEPRQGIYKNTRFSSSFNAFDLDRYCLDEDNKSIRDVAGQIPYDAILIMVNKDRYGGGGIYNCQTVFCTGSPYRDYVFLHEFGHAFAGLGDEYFSSPVAYEDFVTPGVEPLEPNITIQVDSADIKWKKFLSPGITVPTEWGKATFDSLNNRVTTLSTERDQVRDHMEKSGAGIDKIEKMTKDYQNKLDKVNRDLDDFISHHPLKDKVGVFEGANYMSKGFYRPTIMSLMHKFSKHDNSYGIVNEHAIISTIRYYTGN